MLSVIRVVLVLPVAVIAAVAGLAHAAAGRRIGTAGGPIPLGGAHCAMAKITLGSIYYGTRAVRKLVIRNKSHHGMFISPVVSCDCTQFIVPEQFLPAGRAEKVTVAYSSWAGPTAGAVTREFGLYELFVGARSKLLLTGKLTARIRPSLIVTPSSVRKIVAAGAITGPARLKVRNETFHHLHIECSGGANARVRPASFAVPPGGTAAVFLKPKAGTISAGAASGVAWLRVVFAHSESPVLQIPMRYSFQELLPVVAEPGQVVLRGVHGQRRARLRLAPASGHALRIITVRPSVRWLRVKKLGPSWDKILVRLVKHAPPPPLVGSITISYAIHKKLCALRIPVFVAPGGASVRSRMALRFSQDVIRVAVGRGARFARAAFKFNNPSPDAIRIERITTSCSCTSAKASENSIAPGGHGTITATIQLRGLPAKFVRYATVWERGNTHRPLRPVRLKIIVTQGARAR